MGDLVSLQVSPNRLIQIACGKGSGPYHIKLMKPFGFGGGAGALPSRLFGDKKFGDNLRSSNIIHGQIGVKSLWKIP